MLLTDAIFAAEPEFVQEVLEVLKGPADAAAERARLIRRALATLETADARKAS